MILLLLSISKSLGENLNKNSGIISLMYHRFNENKYPSTNIKSEIFIEHLKEIQNSKIDFITFNKFEKLIETQIDKDYLLYPINNILY